MKKNLLTLLFLVAIIFSVNAGNFIFDLFATDSLYPDCTADPYSAENIFSLLTLKQAEINSDRLLDNNLEYRYLTLLLDRNWKDNTEFIQGKTGANVGLLRIGYKNIIETEVQFKAELNTVFDGFAGTDMETLDGVFNLGFNVRLFNLLTLHTGLFHYSGHIGDEMLLNVQKYNTEGGHPDVNDFGLDYCNDNLYVIGVGISPVKGIRFFSEIQWIPLKCWVGPRYIWRANQLKGSGEPRENPPDYPESYKGYISISGIDVEYPVYKTVSIYGSAVIKFHQNGQVNSDCEYDLNKPWEKECGFEVGIKIYRNNSKSNTKLFYGYYDGRFPGTMYFNIRMKYSKIGLKIEL